MNTDQVQLAQVTKSYLARVSALGCLSLKPCVIIWPLSEVMRWIYSENVHIIHRLQPYLCTKYLHQETPMALTHTQPAHVCPLMNFDLL